MTEIESILDNQEVTAETLNDIVLDLGDGLFSKFNNENMYGADDLNEITSNLVSKGILSYGSKCKVSLLNDKVYVADGVIIFPSGVKKKIIGTMSFDYIAGYEYILYAHHDIVNNTCKVVMSTSLSFPDDNCVGLAQIKTDGTVTDQRMLAKAKFETYTEGNSYKITEQIYADDLNNNKTITIPTSGIKKIFIYATSKDTNVDVSVYEYNTETGLFSGGFRKNGNTNESYVWKSLSEATLFMNAVNNNQIRLSVEKKDEGSVTFIYGFTDASGNIENIFNINSLLGADYLNVEFYIWGGI